MTWPIHFSDTQLNLGTVAFPDACPTLPTLKVNIAAPLDEGAGQWRLPVAGIYYWESASASGLILIRSNSLTGAADLVLQIVAASGTGGSTADATAFYADQQGETLKLFTQPGPRGWNCGPQAGAMIHILSQMSISARYAQWLSVNGAHQNLEVNLGAEGGWTLHDPHFGLVYMAGFDGLDLFTKGRAGQPTRNFLRRWQPESPWVAEPWAFLETTYEMGFGPLVTSPVPIVAGAGFTEAQIEAALGQNATLKTAAQMRASYYP